MKVQKVLGVGVTLSSHFLLILEKQYKCYKVLFGKTRTNLNCSVLPLRGEPWGDAGGLECKEDATEIVSSVFFLPLISSVVPKTFWGKLVPKNKTKETHITLQLKDL